VELLKLYNKLREDESITPAEVACQVSYRLSHFAPRVSTDVACHIQVTYILLATVTMPLSAWSERNIFLLRTGIKFIYLFIYHQPLLN
jgi:hypothetical protein